MFKFLFRFALCVMLFGTFACGRKSQNCTEIEPLDSLNIKYARGFSVLYFTDYKKVTVTNFQNQKHYYLVRDLQTPTPDNGVKIQIPLPTLACGSATLYEFLDLLGEMNTIVAITNVQIVYNEQIRSSILSGTITDLGDALSINVEKTLALQPKALIMSGYNATDSRAERIAQTGIPLIINNDWQESSVLGRAEWLKFVAAFFDREQEADSIFSEIVTRYQSVKNNVSEFSHKPAVMSGANFRGTWYMPGGASFMAQLFADAGADYFYSNNKSTASLPLVFETVLKNFANADFWLNCDYRDMAQLRDADPRNMLFKPAKEGNVWNFNRRSLPSGANDFWESGIAHPDLLLLDLIHILHSQNTDYQFVYAKKLE